MGSLFSAISGQFGKPLLFGTLLPVAVAILLFLLLVSPHHPASAALALTFVAVVLTGLLYNLNIPLVRSFEGYTWRATWLGEKRRARYARELGELQVRRAHLLDLLDGLPDRHPPRPPWSAASRSGRSPRARWCEKAGSRRNRILLIRAGGYSRCRSNRPRSPA